MKKYKKNKRKIAIHFFAVIVISILIFVFLRPFLVKAFDEYDFSRTITINLDGGNDTGMSYWSNVDRSDTWAHTGGDWLSGRLGIGEKFYDRTVDSQTDKTNAEHTVQNRGSE